MTMKSDPAIERIRDARRKISARLGNNPTRLVEYYIETQTRFGERLCRGPGDRGKAGAEQGLSPDTHKDARG
jgi:hypothetical protein